MSREKPNKKELLTELRRQRDWYASHDMPADALILNDRIRDLKEGRTSAMVERVMKRFDSAVARYDADRAPAKH